MRTVGTALRTWRLAPVVVEESLWAVFPRRELLLEDVFRLPQWDVRIVASVVIQNAEVRGQLIERVIRESVCSFQVPKGVACDRAYLVHLGDVAYVEKMSYFLFRGVSRHPLMTDIGVRETDPRQWKKSFALLAGTGSLVSFRRPVVCRNHVVLSESVSAAENADLREDYGELRRRVVADPLVKLRRGNDGIGRGREF